MHKWSSSRLSLPLLSLGLLLVVISACDREDNHWDAFDPSLKLLTVVADTMHVTEGGAGVDFRLNIQMVPDDTVWVYVTADDSQVVADPDTLFFAPIDDDWTLPQTVTVSALDDEVDEGIHQDAISVRVGSNDAVYNDQGGAGLVPVLITDNDLAGVHVTETALTLVESTAGTVSESYRIRLLSHPTDDVTITAAETPTEASFHLDPAVLVFTPDNWATEQEIRLWAELDQVDADNMDLIIEHTATSLDPNYDTALSVPSVDVALFDDTLPPTASLALVNPGTTTLTEIGVGATLDVVITLGHASEVSVTVQITTEDGTAVGGEDFAALDLPVVFAPGGALSQVVTISSLDDALTEGLEDFEVFISAVSNVFVGEQNHLDLSIVDDDQVTLSISGVDVNEDDGSANFTISAPSPVQLPIGFTLTTADGTAVAGTDYESIASHFTIEAGQSQRVVPVVILADQANESDENFTAILTNLSSNGVWDGVTGQVVILDDDPQTITFANFEVDESESFASFIIDLAAPYNEDVILTVNTINGEGTGSVSGDEDALGNQDFVSVSSGIWTIPAGSTNERFQVELIRESVGEAAREYFRLNIQSASKPEFVGLEAMCAIVDEDQPQLAVGNASVIESDANAIFTVTVLNQAGSPTVSQAEIGFNFATVDQTATAESDYTTTSGTVVIPAGTTTVDVIVPILEDTHDDDNETFVLDLTTPVNTTILDDGSAPFCTITDNEFPSINLGQVISDENEGSTHEFTVFLTTQRQDATGFFLNLDQGTSDGPGVDYNFAGTGYQVIPAFTSSLTFQVPYLDDQLAGEVDEILQAQLSNADVALGITTLDMTIVDAPAIDIQPDAVTEGTDLVFDVVLSAASTADITFSAQYSSGTANVLVDIDNTNTGPFTIVAGSTTMSIVTPTVAGDGGDLVVEDFVVTIINPVNATLGAFNSAVGEITDGDPPSLNLAGNATALEGTDIVFTVDLSWSSGADVEFYVAFADGTAAGANIDYNSFVTGPHAVSAGSLSTTVSVPTMDLDGPEFTVEDFTISLHTPTNGLLGATTSATGFIQDGDQPELTIPTGDTATEGGNLSFVIHLDPPTIVPVFFDLVFSNGSTQGGADFTPSSTGPFSMMPGTTDTTIIVATIDDGTFENTEQFVVQLASDPTNAVVGTPDQANGIINDND